MFKDINFHSKVLLDIDWNVDGQYLGSSSYDKTVKIGQLEQSGNVKVIQTVSSSSLVQQVLWHPSEPSRFCLAGDDKAVEIWDVRASRASSKLLSTGNNLYSAWSPNGRYLAILNRSDIVTVFDANTGSQIKKVKFQYEVNELQWTANSDHLLIATAGADSGSIDIIKFNGEELFLVDTIAAHTSNCFSLKVDSAVFRRMAVGSGDFNVSLWDLGDMVCHHTLPFDSAVRSLAFSGDGRFLAIAPDSQALITVADVDKGCEVVKVDCKGSVVALSWHPKLPLIALALDDRPVTGGTVTNTQYMRLLSIPQNYVK